MNINIDPYMLLYLNKGSRNKKALQETWNKLPKIIKRRLPGFKEQIGL